MTKIIFIIVDAAIELTDRYVSKKIIKLPNRLLDISVHYRYLIKRPKLIGKHGRPDITHFTLLLLLDSILNRERLLDIYVHTVDEKMIFINPETRLPKNYIQFKGLFAKLLIEGKIIDSKTKKVLLKVENYNLSSFIEKEKPDLTIALTSKGKPTKISDLAKTIIKYEKIAVAVGGFPKNSFSDSVLKTFKKHYSIDPEPLHTWTVTSKIISTLENELHLDEIRFKKHGKISGAGAGI
ncbi:MAG: hypothetical protein ACP6IU_12500 [Candidatus Asgardarchaeia archaeon]